METKAIIIAGMAPFYTRNGDDGTTGLLGEGRVPKYHPRPETLGTLDEASAAIGMARAHCLSPGTPDLLVEVQRDLYQVMAEIAATPENAAKFRSLDADRVRWLEEQIDRVTRQAPPPREFIIPGDSQGGAFMAHARSVVRRSERRVAQLLHNGDIENGELLRYLNRASSLLFALEILENASAGRAGITLARGGEAP